MSDTNVPACPVLLVHGIDGDERAFDAMREHLEARGAATCAVSLVPNNGDASAVVLAQQLATCAAELRGRHGVDRVDLVAFSLGGIVARYYLQRLGGSAHVRRLVTLASPHHGTLAGHFRRNVVAMELRPGSGFLEDLNRDWHLTADQVDVTSIWTPFDAMIVPPRSSCLNGTREVRVPVLLHPWMLTDARCLCAVTDALA